MEIPDSKYKYGIVVDSGSSGSRMQIYKWPEPEYVRKHTDDEAILKSPPQVTQEPDWTKKIKPGISTYNTKTNKIWTEHFKELIEFAEGIIPKEKYSDTPIFVLATAGMRLLSKSDQEKVLKQTCLELKKNSEFLINDCEEHVQVIDGEVEGLYGWLGLNYLMGQMNTYEANVNHESIGFMDMGGASTQIAFVPSSTEEIDKHKDDIARVTLRNINGLTQEWNVFVETWLGFGANQARQRYLSQLVNISKINSNLGTNLNDPCMPIGTEIEYEYEGQNYNIKGIGNYDMCVKTIYPLLLKNVPCKESPCLFNGVHGPKLNFEKDKFVGISEYWYTANDVFESGGEYNYRLFNEKVKEFCELDWSQILSNSESGKYSKLDPDQFLKDACFKASWVINILHEGFELPRLDFEVEDDKSGNEGAQDDIAKTHVPFKSTDSIEGNELSWTLGKILLYASSEIPPSTQNDLMIGVYPSEISGKKFVPAGGSNGDVKDKGYDSDDDEMEIGVFFPILVFILFSFLVYNFTKHRLGIFKSKKFTTFKLVFFHNISKIPGLNKVFDAQGYYNQITQDQFDINLEEGSLSSSQSSPNLTQLRTRSGINLSEARNMGDNDNISNLNTTNFLNKPFVLPKKSFYSSQNSSRESLQRSISSVSIQKGKHN